MKARGNVLLAEVTLKVVYEFEKCSGPSGCTDQMTL